MARLDASHRRRAADAGKLSAARMAAAARAEHDRHARGLSPLGIDARLRPASRCHRRLPGLDARKLISPRCCPGVRSLTSGFLQLVEFRFPRFGPDAGGRYGMPFKQRAFIALEQDTL